MLLKFENPSLRASLGLHSGLLGLGLLIAYWPKPQVSIQDIEFIEAKEAPRPMAKPPIEQAKPEPKPKQRKRAVFGKSRKAITSSEGETVKTGNTVAKTPDKKKLRESDADSLPIPVDEFLVTQMPILAKEVRVPYPEAAKTAGIQGPVILDLLIDEQGKVRKSTVVQGLGYGLDEAARDALMKFEFKPARVDDRGVAVRIRYIYRFVLE